MAATIEMLIISEIELFAHLIAFGRICYLSTRQTLMTVRMKLSARLYFTILLSAET